MVSTTTSVSLKGKNLNKKIGKFNIFEGNGHPFGATVSEGGGLISPCTVKMRLQLNC